MNEVTTSDSDGRLEKIQEFLSQEGFRPEKAGEYSLKLKYEGRTFYVDIDEDDETFYQVIMANIWSIDSPAELLRAYEAASRASSAYKVAKTYVRKDETNVWVNAEQFESSIDTFLPKLIRLIRIVGDEGKTFWENMHELKKKSPYRSLTLSPVPITLIATSGSKEIARCEAQVDCEFLGICSVSDQWFLDVRADTPSSFAVELENEHYPVEVRFMADGNKFVLTDPRGISAVRGIALGIHNVTLQ